MQHFLFPACRGKGTPYWTRKINGINGWMTLGHLNWTICSPQNLFTTVKFPLFQKSDAAFLFSCMQGNGHSKIWIPKVTDIKGCTTLGHSNWTSWSTQNLFLQNRFPLIEQATCSLQHFNFRTCRETIGRDSRVTTEKEEGGRKSDE